MIRKPPNPTFVPKDEVEFDESGAAGNAMRLPDRLSRPGGGRPAMPPTRTHATDAGARSARADADADANADTQIARRGHGHGHH